MCCCCCCCSFSSSLRCILPLFVAALCVALLLLLLLLFVQIALAGALISLLQLHQSQVLLTSASRSENANKTSQIASKFISRKQKHTQTHHTHTDTHTPHRHSSRLSAAQQLWGIVCVGGVAASAKLIMCGAEFYNFMLPAFRRSQYYSPRLLSLNPPAAAASLIGGSKQKANAIFNTNTNLWHPFASCCCCRCML